MLPFYTVVHQVAVIIGDGDGFGFSVHQENSLFLVHGAGIILHLVEIHLILAFLSGRSSGQPPGRPRGSAPVLDTERTKIDDGRCGAKQKNTLQPHHANHIGERYWETICPKCRAAPLRSAWAKRTIWNKRTA